MDNVVGQRPSRMIVGIGGTLSPRSSSEQLVRAVLADCEGMGAATRMFSGLHLAGLPHFNPEAGSGRTEEQDIFVRAIREADGIVIGSPGYHGGYSGLIKNAIDLLEDLRTGGRIYFDGLPVGLAVTAAGWQACGTTLSALRDVVHAMRGWPTPVGIALNSVEQRAFDADGAVVDDGIRLAVRTQAEQIMRFMVAPCAA